MAEYIPKIIKGGAEISSPSVLANLIQTNNVVNQHEVTRQLQETARQTNTANAIVNAEEATEYANTAGELANTKATLADTKATLADTAAYNANTIATQLENETLIIWKPYVATFNDIATTYTTPELGWTTQCQDTGIRWRYNGTTWKNIGVEPTDKSGDLTQLQTKANTNLVGSINEVVSKFNPNAPTFFSYPTKSFDNLNPYESWCAGNLFYDAETDEFVLLYNSGDAHVANVRNVYMRKKTRYKEFSDPILVAEHDASYNRKTHACGILPNGKYISFIGHDDPAPAISGQIYIYESTDKGITWVSRDFLVGGSTIISQELFGFLVTQTGRILVWSRDISNQNYIYYSDDNAITWNSVTIAHGTYTPMEGSMCELSDGTIIAIVRNAVVSGTEIKALFTKSLDNGTTWESLSEIEVGMHSNNATMIFNEKSKTVELVVGSRFAEPDGFGSLYYYSTPEASAKIGNFGNRIRIGTGEPSGNFGYPDMKRDKNNVTLLCYYNAYNDGASIYNIIGNVIDVGNSEIKKVANDIKRNISNGSITHNPDFQVCQRGSSFTSNACFCADRWFMSASQNFTLTQVTNGVNLSIPVTYLDGDFRSISQRMKVNVFYNKYILDKRVSYTISVDDIVYQGSFIFNHTGSGINLKGGADISLRLEWNGGITTSYASVALVFRDNLEHVIQYIKLETGDEPTVFIPKNYDEELVTCRRYYKQICQRTILNTFLIEADKISFNISFEQMAGIPNISVIGVPSIFDANNTYVTDFTFSATQASDVSGRVIATKAAHGLTTGFANFIVGTYVELDAEPTT
jgi:hypothetical protein